MDELESQIAKIQLGNFRSAGSYVYVFAEKAGSSDAELYLVAELPLPSPAAEENCEKICLSIAAALKRVYKKPLLPDSFENAISQINEELGKLVSLGQTLWIDKLNCTIGVKKADTFTIATCGKVASFLLRGGEFTDISCSAAGQSHPLKTFENYASGKIRLGDLLILSTTQLFNYLSLDRFKTIVGGSDFLTATQTIVELLKQNAGQETAFGSLLNLQVPPGQTAEEPMDLENYVAARPADGQGFAALALDYLKNLFAFETKKRIPQVGLPKISLGEKIKSFGGGAKNFFGKSRGVLANFGRRMKNGSDALKWQNFKEYPRQKKFFLVSAAALLLVLFVNIYITVHFKKIKEQEQQQATVLKNVQGLLSNAQASLLYKDDSSAQNFLAQAEKKLPAADSIKSANKNLYGQVAEQIQNLQQKIEKVSEIPAVSLGSLSPAKKLIKLPASLATYYNGAVVSFDLASGKIQDGLLKTPREILAGVFTQKTSAVIFDGSQLYVWDFASGTTGSGFAQSVPAKDDLAGLAYYAAKSRVYALDKKSGQVASFLAANGSLSQPVISLRDESLKNALDLTLDGNIYALTAEGVNKYQSGRKINFQMPALAQPFSGRGKIYTQKDFNYLYVLDAGQNRILILGKSGGLAGTLKISQLNKMSDFQVDEKNKIIYVLNDGTLYKVAIP